MRSGFYRGPKPGAKGNLRKVVLSEGAGPQVKAARSSEVYFLIKGITIGSKK